MTRTWAHLHLPRWQNYLRGYHDHSRVISVKRGRDKMRYEWQIALRDVEFKVHEAGRQKTITTGVRNVHAWCVGEETRKPRVDWRQWKRAIYDPRKSAYFCDSQTLRPLLGAAIIVMEGKDVYYKVGRYAD